MSKTADLIERYGLQPVREWIVATTGETHWTSDAMRVERMCIRAKLMGWTKAFDLDPDKVEPCPEPTVSYPLFEYGEEGPVGHLRNFIDHVWDGEVEWTKKVRDEPMQNYWLQRGIYDLMHRNQHSQPNPYLYNMLCGPASSGKTFCASVYVLSLFYSFPDKFMAKVCSVSKSSAESRIWAEVLQWHEKSYFNGKELPLGRFKLWQGQKQRALWVPKGDDEKQAINDARRGVELVALERSSKGKSAAKALKGMRQDIKILLVDEACDVDPSAFEPEICANWLEAPVLAQIIYLANPSHDSPAFVENYEPAEGADYHQDSPGWPTRRYGWVTNYNGLDTPNLNYRKRNDPRRKIRDPSAPFWYISNQTGLDRLVMTCNGRESAAFYTQAIGFLPPQGIADSILTLEMIRAAGADKPAEWTGEDALPIVGCDPAFGGDSFIVAPGKIGYGWIQINGKRERRVMLEIGTLLAVPWRMDASSGTKDEANVKWVVNKCRVLGINSMAAVASDNTGTSKGFVTAFEMYAKSEGFDGQHIHRVSFREKPTDRPEDPEDNRARKSSEAYMDGCSELLMSLRAYRRYIRNFTDLRLIDQVCKRKFQVQKKGNKSYVQSKLDFKEGDAARGWCGYGQSPDELDAVAVLVDLARSCGLGTNQMFHPGLVQQAGGRRYSSKGTIALSYSGGEESGGLLRYGAA